ncbi:MAG: TIR domain-containing protein [Candidatus Helarchaeota archaeon]
MAYRNKTYVCFDADNNMHYYRLMTAWKENDQIAFNFHNAHEINNLRDGSSEETIKKKLRERLQNTKVLVVLIGEHTKNLYKYVRWEIEYAVENDIPIIGVNLNGIKKMDEKRCPPILRDKLAIHIPYGQKIINYALNNWPDRHRIHLQEGEHFGYYYNDSVYNELGIN